MSLFLALMTMLVVPAGEDEGLRLNQIQVIGSHNSYHQAPGAVVLAVAKGLDYTHRPLSEQFGDLGVRQIELDVFPDPKGGRYAMPGSSDSMRKPGMKVFHVKGVDQGSSTPTLIDALKQVREWSQAHPKHVPIFVLLELKDDASTVSGKPVRFDREALGRLEKEIVSVFERDEILTPDDVRRDFRTLPEAISKRGWPRIDEVRGKVMFALDNEGKVRDDYLEGHPALKGRLMFATVAEGDPAAAWFKINDPVRDFDRIQRLVKAGYMVRTRADASTKQSRENDPIQRDRALASGAQFVSTDYPEPDRRFSDYRVRLPGGVVARVNPVSGPNDAGAGDVE